VAFRGDRDSLVSSGQHREVLRVFSQTFDSDALQYEGSFVASYFENEGRHLVNTRSKLYRALRPSAQVARATDLSPPPFCGVEAKI